MDRQSRRRKRWEIQGGKGTRAGWQGAQRVHREGFRKRAVRLVRSGQGVLRVGSSEGRKEDSDAMGDSVGRRKGLCEMEERSPYGGLWVTETWIHGRLTNHAGFRAYVARQRGRTESTGSDVEEGVSPTAEQRWYTRHRKEREGWLGASVPKRPGLVVLLNAEADIVARREALRCGIPTVGFVREGSGLKERTYGRPGGSSNEDSMYLLGRRRKRAVNEKNTAKV